jgi:uncharacterized protein (TIGR03083 family)
VADLADLCDDLDVEHAGLDALVANLDEAGWRTPTPAPGWSIRDQLAHLAFVEGRAVLSFADEAAFAEALASDRSDAELFAHRMGGGELPADGALVLAAWRATAARFVTLAHR